MKAFKTLVTLGASVMVFALACGKSGIGTTQRPCYVDGHTYRPGDTFKNDCNTCACGSDGQALCTLMACLGDASSPPPAPDAALPDGPSLADRSSDVAVPTPLDASALVCSLSSSLNFGFNGGLSFYNNSYFLDKGGSLIVTRNYAFAVADGAMVRSCSPALSTCGTVGAVSISTIAQDLADPDVQFAFGLTLSHVYGVDTRPVDGAVWSITQASGGNILVGNPCPSPMMNSCQPISLGIQRLADDLKSLATAALAAPACAGL